MGSSLLTPPPSTQALQTPRMKRAAGGVAKEKILAPIPFISHSLKGFISFPLLKRIQGGRRGGARPLTQPDAQEVHQRHCDVHCSSPAQGRVCVGPFGSEGGRGSRTPGLRRRRCPGGLPDPMRPKAPAPPASLLPLGRSLLTLCFTRRPLIPSWLTVVSAASAGRSRAGSTSSSQLRSSC